MKRLVLIALMPLALASCATSPEVASRGSANSVMPLNRITFTALGDDPFWIISISDDIRIDVTLGDEGGRADGALENFMFLGVRHVANGPFKTWESAEDAAVISVHSRPGPCNGSDNSVYENHVRLRLSGRELSGCGGRLLNEAGEGQA